jgi:hypothetical protein
MNHTLVPRSTVLYEPLDQLVRVLVANSFSEAVDVCCGTCEVFVGCALPSAGSLCSKPPGGTIAQQYCQSTFEQPPAPAPSVHSLPLFVTPCAMYSYSPQTSHYTPSLTLAQPVCVVSVVGAAGCLLRCFAVGLYNGR